MIDREEKVAVKVLEPKEDLDAQGNEKPTDETLLVEQKLLEKMTKSELIERLKEVEQLKERNYDLYLRSQAEIDNLRKRNQREKSEWLNFANESLIKEMLPVLDNLEQAISHTDNENALLALKEGVELTLKGLKDTLRKCGLETVRSEGEPFDPNYHEAVSEMEDDSVDKGKVLHELQKGYILNNRLIRPAKVVVSKGKT